MRYPLTILFGVFFFTVSSAQTAPFDSVSLPFERDENVTATYEQTIDFYKKLAAASPMFDLKTYGSTDSGEPLHLGVLSTDSDFDPKSIREKKKQVLMVNNAIHPGEPCGVDASMLLIKDYLSKEALQGHLKNTVVIFIPIYNIGGAINRSGTSRANQNGPASYGFRGNAKNLDLNRDFIKCDSKNAQTFNQIFTEWRPDVFIDNHTSNGADYQYTMTLIPTQHNRLDPNLAEVLNERLLPRLFSDMKKGGWEMTPYVYARSTPDEGIAGFLDLARYSSGYASLFNAISFMPETHMLKPYKDRVAATYLFMDSMIKLMDEEQVRIQTAREKAILNTKEKATFDLNWQLDFSKQETILFKGYEAKYKPSEVSGQDRLYYDHNAPFEKEIPFYNTYKSNLQAEKPIAYIIPQAYSNVLDRLHWNGVQTMRLTEDQTLSVEMYRIGGFKNREAYEGHYLHYDVNVEPKQVDWLYRKGDYVVYVNQEENRYIVETLEPQAPDAFFAWNFFDGILMQKEYFSSYVFEDVAAQYLRDDAELKAKFEKRKMEDEAFAKNARAQLDFIYKHSPHYEYTHRMYPIGRLINPTKLNLK